jgi:deoxyribodipyrimidine photo-lyase
MKQILWFRRDLRVEDSALLHYSKGEVLPIFIFDKNILDTLPKDDKRVTFIYKSVMSLKKQLKSIGLDLAIFYGYPKEIFAQLKDNYDEVLCSCDFDSYAIQRDNEIESLLPMQRFYDSFLIHPSNGLKADETPYRKFTPFYKNLMPLWDCDSIEEYTVSQELELCKYDFSNIPSLEYLGFEIQKLPEFLSKTAEVVLEEFILKLSSYQEARDYFYMNGTSSLSVHLRFGLISVKQVFNTIKKYPNSEFFIRELFWREFYNYILFYFPKSQFENFNGKEITWNENEEYFKAWCEGNTGVPIIDAAMKHLNNTGMMHNRLRMVVASFLTKNLFLPWMWGEKYFALKLLDYEASSNIGSWQWGASTGADSVPYFRIFNPYLQSAKFDKEGLFIKSVLKELDDIEPKLLHKENGVQSNLFLNYPNTIVNIKLSRKNAIEAFKKGSI